MAGPFFYVSTFWSTIMFYRISEEVNFGDGPDNIQVETKRRFFVYITRSNMCRTRWSIRAKTAMANHDDSLIESRYKSMDGPRLVQELL